MTISDRGAQGNLGTVAPDGRARNGARSMLQYTDQVSVVITLSRTYNLTADAVTVARLAHLSMGQLSATVEDGADWEPEVVTLSTMADKADIESEEWDVEEIINV